MNQEYQLNLKKYFKYSNSYNIYIAEIKNDDENIDYEKLDTKEWIYQ